MSEVEDTNTGLIMGMYSAGILKKEKEELGTKSNELCADTKGEIAKLTEKVYYSGKADSGTPHIQKTLDEIKTEEHELNSIDRALHIIEIVSTGLMVIFSIFLFIFFHGISVEYLRPIISVQVNPITRDSISAVYITSAAIFCLLIIKDALKSYLRGRRERT